MSAPDDRPAAEKVTDQLPRLADLADRLLQRKLTGSDPLVIPFIGAGASVTAGLPTSTELKYRIYRELVGSDDGGTVASILDREATFLFEHRARGGILRLSLFEFASVVSQLALGRDVIHDVLSSVLRAGTRRPLAYELLAHLAKHGFVDHFVSMNFDELLDEALGDEISDRVRLVTSPDEVPGPRWLRETGQRPVFLFKPFGSLSRDAYRLRPEDTRRYGSECVWRFMINHGFSRPTGDRMPDVCLLLVGYAAAEPAFRELLDELRSDQRSTRLFAIDPAETLPDSLRPLDPVHIQLPADLACDLLLQVLRIKYFADGSRTVWIPVGRHKIVSYCLDQDSPRTSDRRFRIELILQAVKSRGFFTIEAVADIHRIQKYAGHASRVLEQMCKESILDPNPWSSDEKAARSKYLRQDYRLKDPNYNDLATQLLTVSGRDPDEQIDEWTVRSDAGATWGADVHQITYRAFLVNRFEEIAAAPEVEVVDTVSPATHWLFRNPRPLHSVTDLIESTTELFKKALDEAEGQIELYGVWVTGEWLLHEKGWAWPKIGTKVVERLANDSLRLSVVLAKAPPTDGTRTQRAEAIRERLEPYIKSGACTFHELEWWRHNRTLTLARWQNVGSHQRQQAGGIYMRRRLATPLVAPVRVQSGEDCEVLREIFQRYVRKAEGSI